MAKAKTLRALIYTVKDKKTGKFLGKKTLGARRMVPFAHAEFFSTVLSAKDTAKKSMIFIDDSEYKVISCAVVSDQEEVRKTKKMKKKKRETITNSRMGEVKREKIKPLPDAKPEKKKTTKSKDSGSPVGGCPEHPKFTGVRKPKRTKNYPDGCPNCWRIWEEKNAAPKSKSTAAKGTRKKTKSRKKKRAKK